MLLIVVLVQLGFLLAGRHAAQAACDAGARKLAVSNDETEVIRLVTAAIRATVPGAENLQVVPSVDARVARVHATYRWTPPGPNLVPVTVGVQSAWTRPPLP